MLGQKDMGESAYVTFGEGPTSSAWPGGRKLIVVEPGSHADGRVVNGHAVASRQPEHRRRGESWAGSARLAGQEQTGLARDIVEQGGQILSFEMMKEQIRDGHVGHVRRSFPQPVEDVGLDQLDLPGQCLEVHARLGGDERLPVDEDRADPRPARRDSSGYFPKERAIARSEFDERFERSISRPAQQSARQDVGMTHEGVHAPEIASRVERARIVGRQCVKELRSNVT
jgi:hypothetical protein